uniref:Uncharacterized protein n=1 Tax=Catharus ustulatus TaxID=91951 RepID=A0A8C3V880_CATUS
IPELPIPAAPSLSIPAALHPCSSPSLQLSIPAAPSLQLSIPAAPSLQLSIPAALHPCSSPSLQLSIPAALHPCSSPSLQLSIPAALHPCSSPSLPAPHPCSSIPALPAQPCCCRALSSANCFPQWCSGSLFCWRQMLGNMKLLSPLPGQPCAGGLTLEHLRGISPKTDPPRAGRDWRSRAQCSSFSLRLQPSPVTSRVQPNARQSQA